jgi:uncharacterized damage-inducible protein DinB
MEQLKWFDKQFSFGSAQNTFPEIIERLAGTPARLEEKIKQIPPSIFEIRTGDKWSIKEHAGHLTDLEPLWQGRFQDIVNGQLELRPADLQNTKTDQANHNEKSISDLLQSFRKVRKTTIELLEAIDETIVFKSALHPRLKTRLRTIDLFLFVAEHDDHHLATITTLAKTLHLQK